MGVGVSVCVDVCVCVCVDVCARADSLVHELARNTLENLSYVSIRQRMAESAMWLR
jgi:hypothetical protein